jgi:hypothetical protein
MNTSRPATALIAIAAVLTAPHARAEPPVPAPTVYRLAVPPAGFRPLAASAAELAAYGLPPRPSTLATRSYAAWTHAMAAARFYVAPETRLGARRHGPAANLLRTEGAATSGNWAGQSLQNSAGGYGSASYTEVMGQWVISGVQQAVGICSGTDVSATWVGIDGVTGGAADVLQAGTEADVACTNNNSYQDEYAWVEWYPANTVVLYNFPIVVGGSVFVVVQAISATSGIATFVNLQTGQYTAMGIGAPAGTTLKGNSAEWIVERPSVGTGKTFGTLADFGEIPMESEIAYLVSQLNTPYFNVPGAPTAGQTSSNISMTNTANTTIATTVPQGVSAQLVQVTGPTE